MRKVIALVLILSVATAFWLLRPGEQNKTKQLLSPIAQNTTPKLKTEPPAKEVVGFFPYWMLDNAEFIQYETLSELVYFGLNVDSEGNFVTVLEDGSPEKGWENWQTNEKLSKVLSNADRYGVKKALAVIMQDNDDIASFLMCRSCWSQLSRNTITEMQESQTDNLHLDFEYIGIAPEQLRGQFGLFADFMVKQIHTQFPESIVTIDTFADAAYRARLHDIKRLAPIADRLFIMSYDFHQLSDDQTGPIAPIGGAPTKFRYDLTTMVKDYELYAPKEKLLMGVAYYGHYWITEDSSLGSIRVPGDDTIGYSRISYYKYCLEHPRNTNETYHWDEDAKAPWFSFYDEEAGITRQCHYENMDSLRAKYDFVQMNDLKGIGIWALGYDGDRPELWNLLKEEF